MANLVTHSSGAFAYLPGGPAFSDGVVAAPGFRIAEWELAEPMPLKSAFDRVAAELDARGLGWAALAGVDLRSPIPFDRPGFGAFNAEYVALLGGYYPLEGEQLPPFTRTNVSSVEVHLAEPYVRAVQVVEPYAGAHGDFVLSGVAELRGAPSPEATIAYGDTSPAGMRAKVDFVAATLAGRLAALGRTPIDARIVDAYTAHQLDWLEPVLASTFTSITRFGLHCWPARPPIEELEFELGCKSVSSREVLG